jgi:hypothetical protein
MELLSVVFVVAISITAMALVLSIGMPIIDLSIKGAEFSDGIRTMKTVDNYIEEVSNEGAGAERVLKISSPGEFIVDPKEDSIQFSLESSAELIEYFSRKLVGNLIQISGSDVNCYDDGNLTLENSFIKAAFQKIPRSSPLSSLDTKNNIKMIEEKTYNTVVYPTNSSIVIDDDPASSVGTGYSEILKNDYDLPSCRIHFFVNSTVGYDVFYTLYSGADFVVIDVRNVR